MTTFTMFAGDTKQIRVTITDSAGDPVTLAGATVKYKISARIRGEILVAKQTGGSGITVSSNVATISLAPADTQSLSGAFFHELEVTDTFGNVSTVFQDTINISKDLIT
jgi:hypothetical protein